MKHHFTLHVLISLSLFTLITLANNPVRAEMGENDTGIPFYPGSIQVPDGVPLSTDRSLQSFLNINLVTQDTFKKVLLFYQERLGRFSIFKSQASPKSALWNESSPKGYRIVTLVETQEGTKITITKRNW